MGSYLNPGNEKFRRMIQSEIYIDKTIYGETNIDRGTKMG